MTPFPVSDAIEAIDSAYKDRDNELAQSLASFALCFCVNTDETRADFAVSMVSRVTLEIIAKGDDIDAGRRLITILRRMSVDERGRVTA